MRSVRLHAHLDKRSSRRLLFAGLGFSLAYFLDPGQGRARRLQVLDGFRRARRSARPYDDVRDDRGAADLPRIGWADIGPRATFQRAAYGISVSGRA